MTEHHYLPQLGVWDPISQPVGPGRSPGGNPKDESPRSSEVPVFYIRQDNLKNHLHKAYFLCYSQSESEVYIVRYFQRYFKVTGMRPLAPVQNSVLLEADAT